MYPPLFQLCGFNRLSSGHLLRNGFVLLVVVLVSLALSPTAHAVDPPPDGGYPGNNTAEGDGALQNVNPDVFNDSGIDNTAVGFRALFSNMNGSANTSLRRFLEGVIARIAKDDAKAQAAFTAARAEHEKIIQAQPNYGSALCVLGLIDAALGRKEGALREGRCAVDLCPIEKDAPRGIAMVKYLAMIAAWAGDKDLACEQLAIAIRIPGDLSYGQLKLMPFWDPLRGDPRFEKIVASLAPK